MMPEWMKEIYRWVLKEGYEVNDLNVYKVRGRFAIRPNRGAAGNDVRTKFWYIGLGYYCSVHEFLNRVGD